MILTNYNSGSAATAPNALWRGMGSPALPARASRTFPHRAGLSLATPYRRRGVGVETQTQKITSSAISAGGAAATAGLAIAGAAAAVPVVGAAVGLVAMLASFIGGGCGNACIESSQAEQVYEVACDDLQYVAQAGMLSQAEYTAGIQAFIQAGQQNLEQLQQSGDASAANGLQNLSKATSGNVSYASQVPAAPTAELNLSTAESLFISPSASGWYSASVSAGNALCLQYLQTLTSSGTSVNSETGDVTIAGMTLTPTALLLGAGAIALLLML